MVHHVLQFAVHSTYRSVFTAGEPDADLNHNKEYGALLPHREEGKCIEGLTVMGTPSIRDSDGWGLHDLGAITSVDLSGCPCFDTRLFSVPQILATVRCLSLHGLDWMEDRGVCCSVLYCTAN